MYKQIIIVRKDLDMSSGKMAAQVSHASMAFLTNQLRKYVEFPDNCNFMENGERYKYHDYLKCHAFVTRECFEEWLNGSFTKCVLQAKNKNQLLKAKTIAEELGMKEGEDFFLIRDECRTALKSEDEDGRTLTCIGFKPMDSEIIDKVGKKYHLHV